MKICYYFNLGLRKQTILIVFKTPISKFYYIKEVTNLIGPCDLLVHVMNFFFHNIDPYFSFFYEFGPNFFYKFAPTSFKT